jgi:hypothetical protein
MHVSVSGQACIGCRQGHERMQGGGTCCCVPEICCTLSVTNLSSLRRSRRCPSSSTSGRTSS